MNAKRSILFIAIMFTSSLICYGGGGLEINAIWYAAMWIIWGFLFCVVPILVYRLLRQRAAKGIRILAALLAALIVFPGVCFLTEGYWFSYHQYGYLYDELKGGYSMKQQTYGLKNVGLDCVGWGCNLYIYKQGKNNANVQVGKINVRHGHDEMVVHALISGPATNSRLCLYRYSAIEEDNREILLDTVLDLEKGFDLSIDCDELNRN